MKKRIWSEKKEIDTTHELITMRSRDNFSGLTEQALKYNDQTHHW